jgi:hypothetical protein
MPKQQTDPNGRAHSRKQEDRTVAAGRQKPGRKPGKHSDATYTQTSIYLPIDLRNRVRAKLYERGMEMSGLVEDALREWLAKQQ